jgi:hypothetical protein
MSKYPKLREVYDKIILEDWFKNYRKNPPASSLQELGKINLRMFELDKKTMEYFHNSTEVEDTAHTIVHGQIHAGDYLDDFYRELGVDPKEQQKIFDYLPLKKILELIDYKAKTIAMHAGIIPDPDYVNQGSPEEELERYQEGYQDWLEEQSRKYDPYDGIEPPDLSEGDEPEYYEPDDYDYSDDSFVQPSNDMSLTTFLSYRMSYDKIILEDWFKNYRKNPPASSLQELGDFSNYDEFELKVNSLIFDLVNENNFESSPYQKIFDYLPLASIFNLIQTLTYSGLFTNEDCIDQLDEYCITTKLNDSKTISPLSQIRAKISDVKSDENFSIQCIVLGIFKNNREILTKSGKSISFSRMFVEDESGQIYINGWRNQAKLIDKCELGNIYSITGLNAKENNLEKGRLELFLTSDSTISFKS